MQVTKIGKYLIGRVTESERPDPHLLDFISTRMVLPVQKNPFWWN